jgi:hypothetical protein
MAPVLGGKNSIGSDQKNSAKRRAPDLGKLRINQSQGFNLLHVSPNYILGNWTLDPCLKWALAKELNSLLTQYGGIWSSSDHQVTQVFKIKMVGGHRFIYFSIF